MRLYIVRHGEAERQITTDEARALTPRGRDEVDALWRALADTGLRPTRLVSSPYVRAQQTADIIANRYPGVARTELDMITPDGDPVRALAALDRMGAADGWMLVSHMPFVDLLCGALTDGQRYGFAVGAVACVELEALAPGCGRLLWLRAPGGG
ncbi:MAG: phosphohistidine phosphatase SixA [Alcanivoracaceae bacterium]